MVLGDRPSPQPGPPKRLRGEGPADGWDHERNDDTQAWTVLARPTQPRTRAGRRGFRGEGMGSRTQRRHPAPGWCSRDRPSQNASRPTRRPAARAWDHERNDDTPRPDGARAIDLAQNASRPTRLPAARAWITNATTTPAPGWCSRDRPSRPPEPPKRLRARALRTDGITNATTTPKRDRARATDPARTRAGRRGFRRRGHGITNATTTPRAR